MTRTPGEATGGERPETTVAVVWPSIAAFSLGQRLGRWFSIDWPDIYILRLGNLVALLAIPLALLLYFRRLLPQSGWRYRLTDRQILIERGLQARLERALPLDQFDELRVDTLPGQAWYRAGDLVFRKGGQEVFRLAGVSHPESFRRTCLETRQALVGVREVLDRLRAVGV